MKSVINALPRHALLRVPIKEDPELIRDDRVGQSAFSESGHLVGQEFRLPSTCGIEGTGQRITFTRPGERLFFYTAARILSLPFVMRYNTVADGPSGLTLKHLKPSFLLKLLQCSENRCAVDKKIVSDVWYGWKEIPGTRGQTPRPRVENWGKF